MWATSEARVMEAQTSREISPDDPVYAQVGVIKRLKGSNSGQNGSEGV